MTIRLKKRGHFAPEVTKWLETQGYKNPRDFVYKIAVDNTLVIYMNEDANPEIKTMILLKWQ